MGRGGRVSYLSVKRPPVAVSAGTFGAAAAVQVLAGFTGSPSLWQLSCLGATLAFASLVGWWSLPDATASKKTSNRISLERKHP
jgi:hypothetical protein